MRTRASLVAILPFLMSTAFAACVLGDDWPTYQHDNQRSGTTPERLELPLAEQWVFRSPHAPATAWANPFPGLREGILELPRLRFDDAFQVAAVGESVYFGSSADHQVYALDASSGQLRWSTHTGGAVRLAPTVWQGKVYVGSDDGVVYCLDTATGDVIWKFCAAGHPDKVLGRGKLISLWPVRTGVLIDDGIAYFGAGVFPAEGLYLYAVNAQTGKLIWKNDSYGQGGMGGISPQGYLLASADRIFMSSGRSAPAVFSRKTGRLLYQISFNWRRTGLCGGTYALLADDHLYNGTEQVVAYEQKTGKRAHAYQGHRVVVAKNVVCLMTGKEILALDREAYRKVDERRDALKAQGLELAKAKYQMRSAEYGFQEAKSQLTAVGKQLEMLRQKGQTQGKEFANLTKQNKECTKRLAEATQKRDGLAKNIVRLSDTAEEKKAVEHLSQKATLWRSSFRGSDALILAGDVLFAGGKDQVVAIDVSTGQKLCTEKVTGKARGLAVANGGLLVSTDNGNIHCFRRIATPSACRAILPPTDVIPYSRDKFTRFYEQTAEAIVNETATKRGYCLILGGDDGRLAMELAKRTELQIYVVEPDADKVAIARKALAAAGLYGTRVCLDQHTLSGLSYPKYFANLIICQDSFLTGRPSTPPDELRAMLKPLGGIACVGQPPGISGFAKPLEPAKVAGLQQWLDAMRDTSTQDTSMQIERISTTWVWINRGPLPGAGKWTHQYANPGNTTCSDDQLVKGPLGILWFGDPGPAQVPNRHSKSIAPLSFGGRLFVRNKTGILAYDAYNGLPLWQCQVSGAKLRHMKQSTSNLAASDDSLFMVVGEKCLRIEAATGTIRKTYDMPIKESPESAHWGYLACVGDVIVGSRTRIDSFSDCLFAMDIDIGQPKWVYRGKKMRNNSIAIGDGRLYLVDNVVTDAQKQQALGESTSGAVGRMGKPDVRLVVALDLATGKTLWEKPLDVSDCVKIGVSGGDLTAMYNHNVLLLCGSPWNGHFWKEFMKGQFSRRSLIALSGDGGRLRWSDHVGYRSRPLIVGDTIYAEPWAHDLHTGAPKMRVHPLTGQETKWQMFRPGHHCGCMAASPNGLFFRSGSMGYYDLTGDYGACHYGGQRPGCWINFVPANGLLLIPEASSGCVCPYAVHCTVVLHPKQVNRAWGMFSAPGTMTPVKHMAINFGAPGDRKDAQGTLWLGYPCRRGGRLTLNLDLHHKLQSGGRQYCHDAEGWPFQEAGTPWVFSSGSQGITRCTLPLLAESDEPGTYTVRLYFAEPEAIKPGQRVCDVAIQGKPVLQAFDVVREAGAPYQGIVKEFNRIKVTDNLVVDLTPAEHSPIHEPILCGIEVTVE